MERVGISRFKLSFFIFLGWYNIVVPLDIHFSLSQGDMTTPCPFLRSVTEYMV